ncbi:MAG: LPS assembly lipoprotein LptE [Candidatus Omnitrophota bacterium]|nr:LPS assembly lipoprotein LptE [Candidatus Omnitrophota bacterium]
MIKHRLHRLRKQITQIILLSTLYSLLSTFLVGCGYTTRSIISNKFHTIYITPFVNKVDITRETDAAYKYRIYRPMLETDITKKVTNKYLFDGNLRPVKTDSADLLLKGELVEFRRDPLRYTDNDEVEEYRINIVVNISLWDKKENVLVWQENNFTGGFTYFTSFTTSGTPKSEDVAVNDALDDLARRIVERTVEQW